MMDYSRDSFERFNEPYEQARELSLQAISRKKLVLKSRRNASDRAAGLRPGPRCQRARGLTVSLPACACVAPHDLETMNKRLKALEAKSAHEGLVLTKAQVIALQK